MIITDNNLLIPDEQERRQMFHLLKKHSSWTAWNRILGYYQKWADITEESVRQADNSGLLPKKPIPSGTISMSRTPETEDYFAQTSIEYRDYIKITKGVALFDEGVRRLANGDKRVFNSDEAGDFFGRAFGYTDYYQTSKNKIDTGDIGWEKTTPLMKEFFEALGELCNAWGECAHDILESGDPDDSASAFYSLWHIVFLPHYPYPNPLPDVPKPAKIVEVKTGDFIPCSGIWEPVEGSVHIGAMNYLHGARLAPQLEQSYKDARDLDLGYDTTTEDVTWRLIWRDDRYEDGTIPAEEQDYQFVEPSPPGEKSFLNGPDPEDYLKRHNLPNPLLEVIPRLLRCEGGDKCPQDGFWWTPAANPGTGHFKKGDVMPNYPLSKYGATIWYRTRE